MPGPQNIAPDMPCREISTSRLLYVRMSLHVFRFTFHVLLLILHLSSFPDPPLLIKLSPHALIKCFQGTKSAFWFLSFVSFNSKNSWHLQISRQFACSDIREGIFAPHTDGIAMTTFRLPSYRREYILPAKRRFRRLFVSAYRQELKLRLRDLRGATATETKVVSGAMHRRSSQTYAD